MSFSPPPTPDTHVPETVVVCSLAAPTPTTTGRSRKRNCILSLTLLCSPLLLSLPPPHSSPISLSLVTQAPSLSHSPIFCQAPSLPPSASVTPSLHPRILSHLQTPSLPPLYYFPLIFKVLFLLSIIPLTLFQAHRFLNYLDS